MLIIESIQKKMIELDFSSSNQGRVRVTSIEASEIRLINALELVKFDPESTQVFVCEECGITHCKPGGWVTIRRMGNGVVWIPYWSGMEKGDFEEQEYQPPGFFKTQGMPIFAERAWEEIRSLRKDFLRHRELVALDSKEAVRLIQWTAPGNVLGEFPDEPKLRRNLLIAVTQGEINDKADHVDASIKDFLTKPVMLDSLICDETVIPIEFHLDLPGVPSWTPFVEVGNRLCFKINEGPILCTFKS
jgi:hypothetical protein